MIPLFILLGISIWTVILFWAIYNRGNRVINIIQDRDIGLISEYKNRYELIWNGPWGKCEASYFKKGELNNFKEKLIWFKANYERVLPGIIQTIEEAKKITSETGEIWKIESIICDETMGNYSLIVEIPESKKIPWGIGIELEKGEVIEWELLH